jgi:hypothetical protein
VANHLHLLPHQELLDTGDGMEQSVVPVQEPVLRQHDGPRLSKNLQKPSQGLLDVFGIDSLALGDAVSVNYALRMKEDKDLIPWTRAFTWPGWPFITHCMDCFLVSG